MVVSCADAPPSPPHPPQTPPTPPTPLTPPTLPPLPPFAPGQALVLPGRGTLQAALDEAAPGDELVLAEGSYTGSGASNNAVLAIHKGITIRALNPGQVVLDGENIRRVILVASEMVVLKGLKITKGYTNNTNTVSYHSTINPKGPPQPKDHHIAPLDVTDVLFCFTGWRHCHFGLHCEHQRLCHPQQSSFTCEHTHRF